MKLRFIISIFICLISIVKLGAQTNYTMSNGTITSCSGVLLDPGGTGNYSSNLDITQTICSGTPGSQIEIDFGVLDLEEGTYSGTPYDWIVVYEGVDNTGGVRLAQSSSGDPIKISSSTGCLTIVFHSDGGTNNSGFSAPFSCTSCSDGILNGTETSVDCGGPSCPACPNCFNGIQDGNETGIDVGPSCPNASHCSNGVLDGDETSIDCGGSCLVCPVDCNVTIQATTPTGCCDYTLKLYDTGNDGWRSSANLEVFVNNSSVGTFTPSATTDPFTLYTFSACNEDDIKLDFTKSYSTSQNNEIGIELLDPEGNILYSLATGTNPATNTNLYSITGNCPPDLTCNGGQVELIASGIGTTITSMDNDFDAGSPGTGWITSTSATYTNPCAPSLDGGVYMWMGSSSPTPRKMETSPLDLSCGGELCFLLAYSIQGDISPCEGPDLPDEGVGLQYSTDGGVTWVDIAYWHPDGTLMVSSTTSGSSVSGVTSFTDWKQYCFEIPVGATTNYTSFRWFQATGTDSSYDHWGIDNVTISSVINCDPYVYDWDNIAGVDNGATQSVTVTNNQTYNVTYTNQSGDQCSTNIDITIPSGIDPPTVDNIEYCLNDSPLELTATASGTNTLLWYSSNSGGTGETIPPTPSTDNATTTSYWVSQTNGSCESPRVKIDVIVNPLPTVTVNSPTVCSGNSATVDATPGTAGTYNYSWTVPSGVTNPGNVASFSTNTQGPYSVIITNSSTGCVSSSASGIVSVNPNPSVTVNSPTLCYGNSETVTATTGTAGTYNYAWTVPSGVTDPGNTPSFLANTQGSYSVIITNSSTGCVSSSAYGIVTVNSTPTVTVNSSTICDGGTATVTATVNPAGNYKYVWTVPTGVTNPGDVPSFTTTVAGDYTVNVSPINVLCNNDFEVPTIAANSWDTKTAGTQVTCWKTTATDNKIEIWSNGYGGVNAVSGNQFVELNANQVSTLYQEGFSFDAGTKIEISFSHRGRDGVDVMKVLIGPPMTSPPNNSSCSILGTYSTDNTSWANYSITYIIPTTGSYSLRFESVSAAGGATMGNFLDDISIVINSCPIEPATGAVTLASNPNATISSSSPICAGTSTDVTFTGTPNTTVTYQIGTGGNQTIVLDATGNATLTTDNLTANTTYNLVSIAVGTAPVCTQNLTGNTTITVNPLPTATISGTTDICVNDANPDITFTGANGTAPYTFTYNINGGANTTVTTTSGNSVTVPQITNTSGTFTYNLVAVQDASSNNCSQNQSGSVEINIYTLPVVSFTVDTTSGCLPLAVKFLNNSTPQYDQVNWDFGDGNTFNSTTEIDSVNHIFETENCFDIKLVASANGCVDSLTKTSLICTYPKANAEFTADAYSKTVANPFFEFNNLSTNASIYFWDFDDDETSIETDPKHEFPNDPRKYYITLIANNAFNCSDTTGQFIELKDELIYYVPNSFTPNEDQFNNEFLPVFYSGYDPYNYSMYIFDRWGEIVFETHDIEKGWNGTYGSSDKKVQDGVYIWKIEFKRKGIDKIEKAMGHVILNR